MAQADISRSVAEEAHRAGQVGVGLTEQELNEGKRRALADLSSEEQRKYADLESFLSDYIKGSQATALRLFEMGHAAEKDKVCDPPCKPSERCENGVCVKRAPDDVCPAATPVRCEDGSCVALYQDCPGKDGPPAPDPDPPTDQDCRTTGV